MALELRCVRVRTGAKGCVPVPTGALVRQCYYNKSMRIRIAVLMLVGAWGLAVSQAAVRAQQKSIWEGVFTAEQAERGAATYKSACSECHGGDLMGDGFAPALVGAEFQGNWNDLSVGDLFERIRVSMPPSGPSSVRPAQ